MRTMVGHGRGPLMGSPTPRERPARAAAAVGRGGEGRWCVLARVAAVGARRQHLGLGEQPETQVEGVS